LQLQQTFFLRKQFVQAHQSILSLIRMRFSLLKRHRSISQMIESKVLFLIL
jgi:hypothetical protein